MRRDSYDYDVRHLEVGDPVEVFLEPDHRWEAGVFSISTAGTAYVETRARAQLRFEQALLMGLRKVVVPARRHAARPRRFSVR